MKQTGGQSKADLKTNPLVAGIKDYFSSLRYEWLKVTFPTKKEWTQSTVVVFLFVLILMTIISVYDALMGMLFTRIILPPSITP
jgi:preprotein translocase SecE subunit